MAGIYIHVPYCHRRCHYCDFYTQINLSSLSDFYSALLEEIEIRKDFFLEKTPIETIYFGGGTPSILHANAIALLLEKISKTFTLSNDLEITIEVNPEDVSEEYYRQIRNAGINRLSIGVQSFDDWILKYLNRRHGSEHSSQSIEWAYQAGIINLSIDLIYGIPGMSEELWEKTIKTAVGFSVQHVSAYHLTIESGTTFGILKERGKLSEIAEEQSWNQMKILHELLIADSYEHYEISNFAKKGYRSRHNQSYWEHKPYLGLGPSAHSFDGILRYENVRSLSHYFEGIRKRQPQIIIDNISTENKMNEVIMLQIRRKEGLIKDKFIRQFGIENYKKVELRAQKYYPSYLDINTKGIVLNLKGWFISDTIAKELFFG
ncbi:MAG: radical SAM family heme chaperone HemW [Bacteroidales bacterium]|nr:radical SAM family heme chaperone HemW [Bacteroidales bacterium]